MEKIHHRNAEMKQSKYLGPSLIFTDTTVL